MLHSYKSEKVLDIKGFFFIAKHFFFLKAGARKCLLPESLSYKALSRYMVVGVKSPVLSVGRAYLQINHPKTKL